MYKHRKFLVIILSIIILFNILIPNNLHSIFAIESNTTNVSLTFSESSFSLAYGGSSATNTITVLGTGCTNVLSSHSNKGIVTGTWGKWSGNVISYTLTPLAVGTTTITITPIDSSGSPISNSAKSFSVSVSKAKSSLSFQYSKITKTYGDATFKNILTKTTDGTVVYTSSDSSVATVQDTGVVTIVGAGVCTIKANSTDGNNYLAGNANYFLTVNKANPVLIFSNGAVCKLYGDVPFLNPLSNNSDGTITFATSNNNVATVHSRTGNVTIVGSGTCTITANVTAGSNYSAGSKSYSLRVAPVDASALSSGKLPAATPVSPSYSVVFNSKGGSDVKSQVISAGQTLRVPSNPIKNYYSFEGWYDGKGQKWNFDNVINSNMTLTAKWKVKEVTLKASFLKGKINGKTTPKATIKLIYNNKIVKKMDADAKGNFSFKNLGKYKRKKLVLEASKNGYLIKTQVFDRRKNVALKAEFVGEDKIKGKTTSKATVALLYNKQLIRKVRADSKGNFIMKNLILDQYEGKWLTFQASKSGYKMRVKKFLLKMNGY